MSQLKEDIVKFLKVLAHQTRLDILDILRKTDRTSLQLQNELEKSQSTISKHLNMLVEQDIIAYNTVKVDIKYINHYKIKSPEILKLLRNIELFIRSKRKEEARDISDMDIRDTLL